MENLPLLRQIINVSVSKCFYKRFINRPQFTGTNFKLAEQEFAIRGGGQLCTLPLMKNG